MRKNAWAIIFYFTKNILIVFGLVMIWWGIWYLLNAVDTLFFQGQHVMT